MNTTLGTVAAASLAVFLTTAGSFGPSSAASQTACEVLSADQAAAIVGHPVTVQGRPSPISSGSTVCMYMVAGKPVAQIGLTIMESEAVAVQNVKTQQLASAQHKNVASRQKGNIVLSGITMNGDSAQLNALLDAAVKNLAP